MDAIKGNRTFENFDPSVEWSRAAEADAVKISLPGFKREEIRVLVDNHGNLRIHGERHVAGTRWARFQKDFKLDDNCNVDGIRAKFESETLTITLPKKVPSPQVAPAVPVPAVPRPEPRRPPAVPALPRRESRRPPAAPVQKPPQQALPEPARPAPSQPTVPLVPVPSQRQPAERTPSLPSRLPSVPTPAEFDEPRRKPEAAAAAGNKLEEEFIKAKKSSFNEDEDQKRMERETRGKMEEDRKMMEENNRKMMENRKQRKQQEQQDKDEVEAAAEEMAAMQMARQPRPMAASRGQLVNVAVAVVVLIGITAYVWHTLKNATGDHGLRGYGDEM